ncbi:F-box protein PP2-B10-like isoform X2 [Rhodamnia argentea]|uniref:F-box protein PP2-B10-like isoform X2 n=1 Tax=Rhodamnia argentea TaxID=178133 RepID=A0ABM3HA94_9MYRT|nr:F-box protein PP2-B10-like isoform X2 [Rhodamnia argentea]
MAVTQGKGRDGPDFSALPEGCIASVISFTSPADACRLASVSSVFNSACDSDAVWASFLPPGSRPMVSRSVSSLKELYFSLCDDPVLIGDGKMSFSLDRHSGKKCIMLSARALYIIWGDTPRYWSWNRMPNSRFAEVAELISVCWLEIRGTVSSRLLSPGTRYAAYLVFKSTLTSYGFEFQSVEVGAAFAGDEAGKCERSVYLSRENNMRGRQSRLRFGRFGFGFLPAHFELVDDNDCDEGPPTPAPTEGDGSYPKERRDGWSEIELGEFLTKDGEDGEVEMSVLETKGGNWKAGLVVEGIEIRPKYGK